MSKIHKPHYDPRRRSLLLARVLRALHRLRVAIFADSLLCDRDICDVLHVQLQFVTLTLRITENAYVFFQTHKNTRNIYKNVLDTIDYNI